MPAQLATRRVAQGSTHAKDRTQHGSSCRCCWRRLEKLPVPNRQLSSEEIETLFSPLLAQGRKRLITLSRGDTDLLWALRRKLFKELTYDERGKPMQRRKLKDLKRAEQDNKCPLCSKSLPIKYAVLDRIEAMKGYTPENTRLLCRECDTRVQQERNYK